jgi:hypothetical protein
MTDDAPPPGFSLHRISLRQWIFILVVCSVLFALLRHWPLVALPVLLAIGTTIASVYLRRVRDDYAVPLAISIVLLALFALMVALSTAF